MTSGQAAEEVGTAVRRGAGESEDDGKHSPTLPGCEDRRMTTSSARNVTCTIDDGVARVRSTGRTSSTA